MDEGAPNPPPPKGVPEEELSTRVFEWLGEKWKGDPACPVCGEADWGGPVPVQLHVYGQGAFGGSGQHVAMVVIGCSNCGYSRFFNAIVMGLTTEELDRTPVGEE